MRKTIYLKVSVKIIQLVTFYFYLFFSVLKAKNDKLILMTNNGLHQLAYPLLNPIYDQRSPGKSQEITCKKAFEGKIISSVLTRLPPLTPAFLTRVIQTEGYFDSPYTYKKIRESPMSITCPQTYLHSLVSLRSLGVGLLVPHRLPLPACTQYWLMEQTKSLDRTNS